jgi:hypothetical protein
MGVAASRVVFVSRHTGGDRSGAIAVPADQPRADDDHIADGHGDDDAVAASLCLPVSDRRAAGSGRRRRR